MFVIISEHVRDHDNFMNEHVRDHDDFMNEHVRDHDDFMNEHVCDHDDFMSEHVYIEECHIDLYVMRGIPNFFIFYLIYFYERDKIY